MRKVWNCGSFISICCRSIRILIQEWFVLSQSCDAWWPNVVTFFVVEYIVEFTFQFNIDHWQNLGGFIDTSEPIKWLEWSCWNYVHHWSLRTAPLEPCTRLPINYHEFEYSYRLGYCVPKWQKSSCNLVLQIPGSRFIFCDKWKTTHDTVMQCTVYIQDWCNC